MYDKSKAITILLVSLFLLSACGQTVQETAETNSSEETNLSNEPSYVYMNCGDIVVPTGNEIALY